LFQEQPVFRTANSELEIDIRLIKPATYEIGLLLMLLKDLWEADLTIGGESAIGRGRLRGKDVKLVHNIRDEHKQTWKLNSREHNRVEVVEGIPDQLQAYVSDFERYITGVI
jgi:hypothetical protein